MNSKVEATEDPIFNGRDFDHWLSIAKRDRHPQSMADALVACEVLAKDAAEKKLVDDLLTKLVREHGSYGMEFIDSEGNRSNDTYLKAIFEVLNKRTPKQVVQFIMQELHEGTVPSRRFCCMLLSGIFIYDNDGNNVMQLLKEVGKDSKAIFQAIEKLPPSPDRERLFGSLIGPTSLNQLFDQEFSQELKNRIIDGNDKDSLELFKITSPILGSHKEVYARIDGILFGRDTTKENRDEAFLLIAGDTKLLQVGIFGFHPHMGRLAFQDNKLASILKLLEIQINSHDALAFKTQNEFEYQVDEKTKTVSGRNAIIRRLTTAIVRNTEGNIRPEQSELLLKTLVPVRRELLLETNSNKEMQGQLGKPDVLADLEVIKDLDVCSLEPRVKDMESSADLQILNLVLEVVVEWVAVEFFERVHLLIQST